MPCTASCMHRSLAAAVATHQNSFPPPSSSFSFSAPFAEGGPPYVHFILLFSCSVHVTNGGKNIVEGKVPWNTGTILPSSICTENGLVFSPLPLALVSAVDSTANFRRISLRTDSARRQTTSGLLPPFQPSTTLLCPHISSPVVPVTLPPTALSILFLKSSQPSPAPLWPPRSNLRSCRL
jgi:hypothetical protein